MRIKKEILNKYLKAFDKCEFPNNTIHEVITMAIYDKENEDSNSIEEIPYKLEYLEASEEIRQLQAQIEFMKTKIESIS